MIRSNLIPSNTLFIWSHFSLLTEHQHHINTNKNSNRWKSIFALIDVEGKSSTQKGPKGSIGLAWLDFILHSASNNNASDLTKSIQSIWSYRTNGSQVRSMSDVADIDASSLRLHRLFSAHSNYFRLRSRRRSGLLEAWKASTMNQLCQCFFFSLVPVQGLAKWGGRR